MKHKHTAFLFILLFIAFTPFTKAQVTDSITFSNVKWNTQTIKKGIYWKQANIKQIFNSQQEFNIIEIDLKKHRKKLGLVALPKSREKTSSLAQQHRAIVALNGGFFDVKNGGAVDFIKVDNQVINTTAKKSDRANAYFAFNGKNVRITGDSSSISSYSNILLSGPLLLKDGTQALLSKNAFNDNRHPRTAIAIKGDRLILLTVDGRNAQSKGLSLHELSQIFRWYGCQDAMNLDGGGSTTMYIKGQPADGVVNYPSDNKLFDHFGERAVSNIIYLK